MATEEPSVLPGDMISSFFYADPNPAGMSYEQLKQRRAVAAALASRARPYPKTFGEGLSSAAEGITEGLYQRRTDEFERQQRELDRAARSAASGAPVPAPAPAPAPAPGSAGLDASSMTAELSPEVDAGRSALAETAISRPQGIQMASLNAGGTMSDAGQPGATYAGPQAAGPGAAIAERPDTTPPDTVASGRDSLVPAMMAQAGSGRPPAQAAPGASAGKPAYGSPVQPPAAPPVAPPAGLPAPGQSLINEPPNIGPEPVKPRIQQDTPDMARIKGVLASPRFDTMAPHTREALTEQLTRLKMERDKLDEQKMTEWNRLHGDWLARRKEGEENTRKLPEQQRAATEEMRKEVINRRFGSEENYKKAAEVVTKSAEPAKQLSDNLPRINEAIRLLNSRNIIAGPGTSAAMSIPIPGTSQNLDIPGAMSVYKAASAAGYQRPAEMVRDTEQLHAKLYPLVGAMLALTTGRSQVSQQEGQNAMKAIGLDPNLDLASQQKIVSGLRDDAIRMIRDHNDKVRSLFNDPRYDQKMLQQNLVPIQFDQEDVNDMKRFGGGTPRPQEIALFEKRYGPGSAARALRGEKE